LYRFITGPQIGKKAAEYGCHIWVIQIRHAPLPGVIPSNEISNGLFIPTNQLVTVSTCTPAGRKIACFAPCGRLYVVPPTETLMGKELWFVSSSMPECG